MLDTGVAAVLETTCVCLVGDDEGGAVAARCALVSEKCGEPRAAARNQYCEPDRVVSRTGSGQYEAFAHGI